MSFKVRALVCVALFAVGAGCTPEKPPPVAEATISSEGGTLEVTEGPLGGTKLEVPPGAVPAGVKISVRAGTDLKVPGATKGGPAIEFGPAGTKFTKPVTLTMPFDPSAFPSGFDASQMAVWIQEADGSPAYPFLTDEFDFRSGRVTLSVSGFTTFQVLSIRLPVRFGIEPFFGPSSSQIRLADGGVSGAASATEFGYVGEPRPDVTFSAEVIEGAHCTDPCAFQVYDFTAAPQSASITAGSATIAQSAATFANPTQIEQSPVGEVRVHSLELRVLQRGTTFASTIYRRRLLVTKPSLQLQVAHSNPIAGESNAVSAGVNWPPGITYSSAELVLVAGPADSFVPPAPVAFGADAGLELPFTLNRSGAHTLELRAGSLEPVRFDVVVNPGPATRIEIEGPDGGAPAYGTLPPVRVRLADSFGNSLSGPITLAVGPLGQLSGTTTKTANGDWVTFDDLSVDRPGPNRYLTAESGSVPNATSAPFEVTPIAPNKLTFDLEPRDTVAGTATPVQVRLTDDQGRPTFTQGVNVALTLGQNPGNASLAPIMGTTDTLGIVRFGARLDAAAEGYTLLATAAGLASATSQPFDVTGAAAAELRFSPALAAQYLATDVIPVRVELRDVFGNLATSAAPVTLILASNPGGAALSGTTTANASGGVAQLPVGVTVPGTGYTLSAASPGLTGAQSTAFDIAPGAAARLAFAAAPLPAIAGAPIPQLRLLVQDVVGNIVPSSSALVTMALSGNPTNDTLNGTLTQNAASGEAVFSDLVLRKASTTYALTASSPGLTPVTASGVTVLPAAPAALAFTRQPQDSFQLLPLVSAPEVAVNDAFGNLTTATTSVTLALVNGGGAQLGGMLVKPATGGLVSFSDLSVDLPGAPQLVASATGLTGATSDTFTVTPLRLAFTQIPVSATEGGLFTSLVEVRTPMGTVASVSPTVTIALANNPSGGTLSGTASRAAVNGVASFSGLSINNAGTGYTLTASAPGMSAVTSGGFDVTSGLAQITFTKSPTAAPPGGIFEVEVAARDIGGTIVTTYSGPMSVRLGADPASGSTLGGTLTVAAVAGRARFRDLSLDRTGVGFTIIASVAGAPDATSTPFTIAPGTASDGVGRLDATGAFSGTNVGWTTPWMSWGMRDLALDTIGHRLFVATSPQAPAVGKRLLVYNLSNTDDFTGVDHIPDLVFGVPDLWSEASGTLQPSGLAIDVPGRRLFVTEHSGGVRVFDITNPINNQTATMTIASPTCGFNAASNTSFSDLEYDPASKRLFVACTAQNRVLIYDADPATLTSSTAPSFVLGQPDLVTFSAGTTAAKMWAPTGLALDSVGNRLFVVDAGNHRVLGFPLGSLANGISATVVLGQSTFTSRTTGNGAAAMNNPVDVAADAARLYVVETNNNRVGVFPLASLSNGMAAVNVLGNTSPLSVFYTDDGTLPSRMQQPRGGILATGSRLFVSDGDAQNRVLTFDVSTITDTEDAVDGVGPVTANGGVDLTRNAGLDPTTIQRPMGVVVDTTRHWLYVADLGARRVLGFQLSANDDFTGQDRWADRVIGRPNFGMTTNTAFSSGPTSLAFDEQRNLLFVTQDLPGSSLTVWDLGQPGVGLATPTATLGLGSANSATSVSNPDGLAWDPARKLLFVAEFGGSRVSIFDLTTITSGQSATAVIGQPNLTTFDMSQMSATVIRKPTGLAFDQAGRRLFVAVAENNRVLVFDVSVITSGQSASAVIGALNLTTPSSGGVSSSLLLEPSALSYAEADQRLYVADSSNCRVVAFDVASVTNGMSGVSYFGQASWTGRNPNSSSTFCAGTQEAPSANNFGDTKGVFFDQLSRKLWVSDQGAGRVLAFPVP